MGDRWKQYKNGFIRFLLGDGIQKKEEEDEGESKGKDVLLRRYSKAVLSLFLAEDFYKFVYFTDDDVDKDIIKLNEIENKYRECKCSHKDCLYRGKIKHQNDITEMEDSYNKYIKELQNDITDMKEKRYTGYIAPCLTACYSCECSLRLPRHTRTIQDSETQDTYSGGFFFSPMSVDASGADRNAQKNNKVIHIPREMGRHFQYFFCEILENPKKLKIRSFKYRLEEYFNNTLLSYQEGKSLWKNYKDKIYEWISKESIRCYLPKSCDKKNLWSGVLNIIKNNGVNGVEKAIEEVKKSFSYNNKDDEFYALFERLLTACSSMYPDNTIDDEAFLEVFSILSLEVFCNKEYLSVYEARNGAAISDLDSNIYNNKSERVIKWI